MAKKMTHVRATGGKKTETGTALVPLNDSSHALVRDIAQGNANTVILQEGRAVLFSGVDYRTGNVTIPAADVYIVDVTRDGPHDGALGGADKVAWSDAATGYDCIIMRDTEQGFLSGYVGLPEGHPLYGFDHAAVPSAIGIEVHGGLTYSAACQRGPTPARRIVYDAQRICHIAVGTMPINEATDHQVADDAWWLGLRCNHIYDVIPVARAGHRRRYLAPETGAAVRDEAYVHGEVMNLAAQLKAIADGVPAPPRQGPPLPPRSLDPWEVN